MCIYIYIHIYVCIYIYIRLYVFIYVVVSSLIHKDVYIYICLQSVRIPSSALKGGRRHQGVSPFIYVYIYTIYVSANGANNLQICSRFAFVFVPDLKACKPGT